MDIWVVSVFYCSEEWCFGVDIKIACGYLFLVPLCIHLGVELFDKGSNFSTSFSILSVCFILTIIVIAKWYLLMVLSLLKQNYIRNICSL